MNIVWGGGQILAIVPKGTPCAASCCSRFAILSSYSRHRLAQTFAASSGDDAAALAIFERLAEQSISPEAKASVYHQLYSTATVAQKSEHALVAVKGLVELQPGFETYYIAAETYAKLGDVQRQIDSLKLAASTLSSTDPEEQAIKQQLESQAQQLEAGAEQ